jgi:hypothetical protein
MTMVATTSKRVAPTWCAWWPHIGNGKHQVWPPTDHFEKILEETCQNYAYPVKHKLRDCSMMKNFMASGSPA